MVRFYIFLLFTSIFLSAKSITLNENFENSSFTKGTYDVNPAGNGSEDNITLSSGSWRSYEGVRGNSGSDRFNGTQSVRVRGSGSGAVRASIEMNFDKSSGAGTITVYAAKYGTDANSYFHFEASTDGGVTWPNISSTFTVSSTTLTSYSWTPNLSGNVRVKMVKETNNNRLNFDDFSITDYSSGTAPEIQLEQPVGTDVACGISYDFGAAAVGSNTDVTVRIKNTGTATLNISGAALSGTNAAEFSIQTAPASTVAIGSYTDMVIRYSPQVFGTKTATLTISSDDANESSCTIDLTASAYYNSCTELIISEYGEPTSGNGKYIELYNGTSASINLAGYQLWSIYQWRHLA